MSYSHLCIDEREIIDLKLAEGESPNKTRDQDEDVHALLSTPNSLAGLQNVCDNYGVLR
jgi:hypothetical protein